MKYPPQSNQFSKIHLTAFLSFFFSFNSIDINPLILQPWYVPFHPHPWMNSNPRHKKKAGPIRTKRTNNSTISLLTILYPIFNTSQSLTQLQAPVINLPLHQTRNGNNLLSPRDNPDCPNTISGGGIAGIVLGTIAGTLLILWLWHLCSLPGASSSGGSDYGEANLATSTTRRRRRRHSSPTVYYLEKHPSGHGGGSSVRRPTKVYLS